MKLFFEFLELTFSALVISALTLVFAFAYCLPLIILSLIVWLLWK
jgi:hypothetical protein